jgi:hypothetical protein
MRLDKMTEVQLLNKVELKEAIKHESKPKLEKEMEVYRNLATQLGHNGNY